MLTTNLFSNLNKIRLLGNYKIAAAIYSKPPMRCIQIGQCMRRQVLTKTMRLKHEDHFKRIDGIPNEFEMIYMNQLHYTLNFGKFITIATSIVLPSAYLYYYGYIGREVNPLDFVASVAVDQHDIKWFLIVLLISNVFLYRICHITTLRMYRHEKNYIAVVPGILPRRNELFHFNQGEVVENFNTLSFFRGLSYKVKDRTMLLVPERFRRAVDLFDMLNAADSKKYQYDSKKN